MQFRSKLLAGALLVEAMCVATPLLAQEAPAQTPTPDGAVTIADVVVTARRRSESLQATPIAVTAVSGDSLEARQATSLDSIAKIAPALTINGSAAFSGSSQTVAVFLRGIGQTDFTLNADPGVGIYVDGVYVSRSVGALLDFLDVDRVEVLRGPQGTLFGRNAVGGAISITSRQPGSVFGGRVYGAAGSDDLRIFGARIDAPIGATLRTSFTVQDHQQDGYVTRLTDGVKLGDKDNLSARFAALWTPTDRLDVALNADYSRSRESGAPLVLVQVNPMAAIPAVHNVLVAPTLNPALIPIPGGCLNPAGAAIGGSACYDSRWITGDLSTVNSSFPAFSNVDVWGGALTATYRLGEHSTIKSISAFRKVIDAASRDGDGSPLQVTSTEDILKSRQLTEELQWLGDALDGRLNYILGAYFFDERGANQNFVDFGFVRFLSGGVVHNSSIAAFGAATYKLTDQLSATLGLRYTDETKRFTPDQFVISAFAAPFTPGERLTTSARQTAKANELTPRVDLSWRPNEDLLAYVSYSKGFKSGGFTQRIFPPLPVPPAFGPETASVYEAGAKIDLLDRRLRINGAAYYTDYQDLQITVLVGAAPTVQNAASARIAGFELEFTAIPVKGLTATLSTGYTDAAYRELDARVSPTITLDSKFPGTSKWTANGSLAYEIGLGDAFLLTPRVDWSYRSRFFFDADNVVGQGGYGLLDASLALAHQRQGWTAALYGKNITDKRYAIHGEAVLNPLGWKFLAPGRGAQWGVRLEKTF